LSYRYGKNSFPPPTIKGIMELVAENFDDTINQVLFGAAVVSIIIGLIKEGFPEGLIEGTSILISLSIIIVVNSGNNWVSERRLAALVNLSEQQDVAVQRGSAETITIDSRELVVGDLVHFEAGMKVPADMVMVEGQDVSCNEGELTGEPDYVEKYKIDSGNWQEGIVGTMLAKSLVATGFGKAVVLAVGPYTVAGVITEKTQAASQPTLLQQRLETIADKIGQVGIACALLTFFAMVFRTILEMTHAVPCGCGNLFKCEENPDCVPLSFAFTFKNRLWMDLLNTVIIAITIIVVAIPEGLPLAVTISLSFSSAKMRQMNNLVRKLASAETMGGATHICSDKTGTLTLNKMTTMACFTLQKAHYMPGAAVTSKLAEAVKAAAEAVSFSGASTWSHLVEGVLWNSSARLEQNDGSDPLVTDQYLTRGNVTEQGLIKFFMGVLTGEGCVSERARLTEETTLCVVSFSSSRKRGSIAVRNPAATGTDREVRVYTKGAPDMVLESTTQVLAADGSIASLEDTVAVPAELLSGSEQEGLTDTHRGLFNRTVKKFAAQAYRTLLITYRDMSMDEYNALKAANNDFEKEKDREVLEQGLTAIGLFGLQDPLRPTIVDSIRRCKTAGIQVIMCTGDNIDTAIAISKNAGIVTEAQVESSSYTCMTGKDFREAVGGLKQVSVGGEQVDQVANMKKFREIKEHLRVLARSSPEDKYLLVTGIQACDGVVAVTGDGTNDAPALTKADVGFAMGITGTDVAKGASDIILLDDNFSSIIVALRYGRNVYDNVRKFIQFQLTVNVVAMFIVFFSSVVLKDSPLNAVQMLWVNLIMDTMAALALATEPPAHDVLERQPYSKDAPIVTDVMWRNIFGHAIYQIIALVVILFTAEGWFVADYSSSCLKFHDKDPKAPAGTPLVCAEWNPFYAAGLYQDRGSQTWWEQRKLSSVDFNQDLLKAYSCDVYLQDWEPTTEQKTVPDCDGLLKEKDNRLTLPGDAPAGTRTQKLLHYTMVFQMFVFMQLFNQINARKIEEGELNVFKGFFNNFLFLFVTILTFVVQMAMVEVGGVAIKTWPLNTHQNVLCLIFGAVELVWGLIIKFLPTRLFTCITLSDHAKEEDEPGTTMVSRLKASSRLTKPASQKMAAELGTQLLARVNAAPGATAAE
jgi:Ca2+ transporting ATPase